MPVGGTGTSATCAQIWADLATPGAEPQVIELVGRRAGPYVWLPVIETFAEEIRFGAENEAVAWGSSESPSSANRIRESRAYGTKRATRRSPTGVQSRSDPRHVGPGLPEPGASRPCTPRYPPVTVARR